jgi:hypothetical protein
MNKQKYPSRRGRFYFKDDKPYTSVTNAISTLDKPSLRWWFGKEVYLAMTVNPGLSQEEALKAPYDTSDKAKSRGITVHSIVESYKAHQTTITPPEGFDGYAKAFYRWIDEIKPEILENEKEVYSEKYEFAGKTDLIYKVGNEVLVGDVKTGKALYDEIDLQLSAYVQAIEEMGVEVNGAYGLLLKEDGSYIYERRDHGRLEEFLACKKLHDWVYREDIKRIKSLIKK